MVAEIAGLLTFKPEENGNIRSESDIMAKASS
jgi:hypothetical protein